MATFTVDKFLERRKGVNSFAEQQGLLDAVLAQENEYRGLFSQHRESWEVPEVQDPYLFLVDCFEHPDAYQCLPKFAEDTQPRCFELGSKRRPEGEPSIVNKEEFEMSWDCFTESQLRHLDWENVFAAGGSVGACIAPLPDECKSQSKSKARMQRRKHFHDVAYPGSDIDLFLYGLDEKKANAKLQEIYDAVQAACPYQVICFRSAHAITLVSQYPFRNVQVVLRLYNSPAEVLMGFDVDACACGYDGKSVWTVPRTTMAFAMQSNSVDMSRRSPSYEMRLSKYAQRGFEVVVPALDRVRVDPFIYEKRFDQVTGLARLLLLEKLNTPEARFQYQEEKKLQNAPVYSRHRIMASLRKTLRDKHQLARMDDAAFAAMGAAGSAEMSNYSTVFLPWGPEWTAGKVRRQMQKKDRMLNTIEFRGGQVTQCTRKYKVHVCAAGTMEEVIKNPWPRDPPIPDDVPAGALDQCVHGPVSYLVDNPGRQQIGSFNPITEGDWTEGAFMSEATQKFVMKCAVDDHEAVAACLREGGIDLVVARDFLGRTALHVAVLTHAAKTCQVLLQHPSATKEFLGARLSDGRTALHLAAMYGHDDMVAMIVDKNKVLDGKEPSPAEQDDEGDASEEDDPDEGKAAQPTKKEGKDYSELDIDGSDWDLKLSPLQYAVLLGHAPVVEVLLREGASAIKQAVHKDKNMSFSTISLCALYGIETQDLETCERVLKALVGAGACASHVNLARQTIWHDLASRGEGGLAVLSLFLRLLPDTYQTVNLLEESQQTALLKTVMTRNHKAAKLLVEAKALPVMSDEMWTKMVKLSSGTARFRRHVDPNQASMPLIHAVKALDIKMVKVFLDADPGLAQTKMKDDPNSKALLDVLDETVKHITTQAAQIKNQCDSQQQTQDNKAKVAVASLEAIKGDGYERYMASSASLALHETIKMSQTHFGKYKLCGLGDEEDVSDDEDGEDDGGEEVDDKQAQVQSVNAAVERVRKLAKEVEELLTQHGAVRGPATKDPQRHHFFGYGPPLSLQQSHRRGGQFHYAFGTQQNVHPKIIDLLATSPFASYLDVEHLPTPSRGHHNPLGPYGSVHFLPSALQAQAHQLFTAAFDSTGEKVLALAGAGAPVTVLNAMQATPLWIAALRGGAETVRAVYEAAQTQYKPEPPSEPEPGDPHDLKGQLRKIDNLAIARSSGLTDTGPTPDQLREELESLHAGIKSSTGEAEQIWSGASPQSLLLASAVLHQELWDAYLPRLRPLLERHRSLLKAAEDRRKGPETDQKGGTSSRRGASMLDDLPPAVSLSPLLVAILRGDVAVVEAILSVAVSRSTAKARSAGDHDEGETEKDAEGQGEDEEVDEDQDECDEDEDDEDDFHEHGGVSRGLNQEKAEVSQKELRAKLFARGLHVFNAQLTIMDVVIAMDDPDMFVKVAEYAEECALPLGAVEAWSKEVELPELEASQTASQKRRYRPRLEGEQTCTLLQKALLMGASKVAEALVSGAADTALLSWLQVGEAVGLPADKQKKTEGSMEAGKSKKVVVHDVESAQKWMVEHLNKKPAARQELAQRLIRPGAVDAEGRAAVFYARPDAVPRLLALPGVDLEQQSAIGARPFLAAAAAGDLNRCLCFLKAGCDATATYGKRKWNALHVAMASQSLSFKAKEVFFEGLLKAVTNEDAVKLLLATDAEHTPLMLAVDRNAPIETLEPLLRKIKEAGVVEALARRDSGMNTLSHKMACSDQVEPAKFKALMAAGGTMEVLGPNVENGRGRTALELVMESVAAVWDKAVPGQMRGHHFMNMRKEDGKNKVVSQRESVQHLTEVAASGLSVPKVVGSGQRRMITFEEVQQSTEAATSKAEKAAGASLGRQAQDEEEHDAGRFCVSMWNHEF